MALLLFSTPKFPSSTPPSSPRPLRRVLTVRAVSTAGRKSRKKKQSRDEESPSSLSPSTSAAVSAMEKGLRFTFMEELMERARNRDSAGVSSVIYDMIAAGLTPGPRGMEILAAMEKLKFDIRKAWLVLATCGIPEIAFTTFENMEYGGEDFMKPDTETYNWVIQAYTRAESYDRVQDVAELLGMMVEDYKRVYNPINPSFSALKNFPGGTTVLHNEGNFGDPLSLYLRALCREGIVEMLEALEAMAKDQQPIAPRAMILTRKYRSLVSSWIEPLQEEADIGKEIDYIARYIEEGGLTGERIKRWVPRRGKTPLDPDAAGFAYSNPMETSFKQRCLEELKIHHRKLLQTLRNEGPAILGDVSENDILSGGETEKIIKGPDHNTLKPKAASKMIVSELKEELEAQGLPIDGTRQVLYQRVQKARRINRSRGRPLWVPPVEEEEEEVDEELDELISRIKLEDGNTEFWIRRFLGEGLNNVHSKDTEVENSDPSDMLDDADEGEDASKETEDDDVDEEEEEVEQQGEEVEQTENQTVDRIKEKEAQRLRPLQMIGVQLLKDFDPTTTSSRKSRRRVPRASAEEDDDDDWFPEDPYEAFKEMRERRIFDVSDMFTIADAWGWTWERELKMRVPREMVTRMGS
ncbi:hypothetical protein J5N97_024295 [Dioscorea zingiberensis]|uniref:SAP domain-containing protein n=1 Tax=Dioscorea zingiberensis TaxID=325984 RepID=A0A9D5C6Z3_9LILI|nr:hypothetical protein J5N97_024295 [Dioscorea zingiberensis]